MPVNKLTGMEGSNSIPEYFKVFYKLIEGNRYQANYILGTLPENLYIESTLRPDKIQAKVIIRGKKFFTGLRPTHISHWYTGDNLETTESRRQRSLVIFQFSPNKEALRLFYFPGYSLYPQRRKVFLEAFIQGIKKNDPFKMH